MQSRLLEEALADFAIETSGALQAQLTAGAEVPFELEASTERARGGSRAGLQLYSPQTSRFIAEHWTLLSGLRSCERAIGALQEFRGLDRYLASLDLRGGMRSPGRGVRAAQALKGFLGEVFEQQSDFALHEPRLRAALARVQTAAAAESGLVTLLASLRGLAVISRELPLTESLAIARQEALCALPEQALALVGSGGAGEDDLDAGAGDHLLVVVEVPDEDGRVDRALRDAQEQLRGLLRALRLYGDGRIALGPLACARVGDGPFAPVALACGGGSPRGVLIVRPEQEDELRAFCNLLLRRAPRADAIAWALRRFELGCERAGELEALSDNLLALQALLEPDRVAPGLLASRTAALCAPLEDRKQAAARVLRAIELERDLLRGEATETAGAVQLAREIEGDVRALLRDVICGHLQPDLMTLADEMTMLGEEQEPSTERPRRAESPRRAHSPRRVASSRATVDAQATTVRRARGRLTAEETQLQDALPI